MLPINDFLTLHLIIKNSNKMRKLNLLTITLAFLVTLIFNPVFSQNENNVIGKQDLTLESDIMTPEVLWSLGRVGDIQLSPDKKYLLFGISYYSKEENKGNRDLYVINLSTNEMTKITNTPYSEFNALWRPDGKKIGFISSETESLQLWEMNPDGSNKVQITNIEGGITGFKYSPDQTMIMYTKEVKIEPATQDIYPDLDKTKGRIITDLMYRHWDEWVDSYSHVFIADYNENGLSNSIDIMKDEPYESPMKPFGGTEQITFTPDSKALVYTCRKKKGLQYSISTNSDLYYYDIKTKTTKNLTEGMMGYDTNPVYSPDGKWLTWESMEHDGYESDKNRLYAMNTETGEKTDFSADFDQNAHGLSWDDESKVLYFTSEYHGSIEIYKLTLKKGKIEKITDGVHNYGTIIPAGKKLIATRTSMSMPAEIYSVNIKDGKADQISFVNKDILGQLTMGKVEARWITTTDNKKMLTWIIYPPHFDPDKKYPALLYCQGGPQSMVSQFWSYRWNFQMMAANDYIIVAPNRRGLPGFGQKWNAQISGDYGGQNMKDYFSAIDSLKKEPFIDENKLGAVGASYGGFSVYWLAGHHKGRFKAFIAHDGIFNLEQQYVETDELWFANWDLGGPFWDKNNKTAQRSYANSPHRFVEKWDTPILVIHSAKDYRILDSQGFSAFDAAIIKGVPAKMLWFPDENHWILKPQNGILWQREFFSWLDKWLK
jgi:dipeptidyl aminopeptidase/acylaminoacyl peptidase